MHVIRSVLRGNICLHLWLQKKQYCSVLLNQLLSGLSEVGKEFCVPSERAEVAQSLFKTYMIHTFSPPIKTKYNLFWNPVWTIAIVNTFLYYFWHFLHVQDFLGHSVRPRLYNEIYPWDKGNKQTEYLRLTWFSSSGRWLLPAPSPQPDKFPRQNDLSLSSSSWDIHWAESGLRKN